MTQRSASPFVLLGAGITASSCAMIRFNLHNVVHLNKSVSGTKTTSVTNWRKAYLWSWFSHISQLAGIVVNVKQVWWFEPYEVGSVFRPAVHRGLLSPSPGKCGSFGAVMLFEHPGCSGTFHETVEIIVRTWSARYWKALVVQAILWDSEEQFVVAVANGRGVFDGVNV